MKLAGVRNIVPIIDSGETPDHWVMVMRRAEESLWQHMSEIAGPLDADAAIPILADIATALADLDGKVVHRDLKPENVLLLDGAWCLADFGISRYAEATTAPDTQKFLEEGCESEIPRIYGLGRSRSQTTVCESY